MTLTTLAWLGMAAYAVHILEEYIFDWRNWAHAVLKLPVEWSDFYVINGGVVALGIAQAMLASTLPLVVLSYASLEFINALFMHVTPFIRMRGRFSPGLITATFIFLPLSIATFWTAWSTGLATFGDIVLGFVIGGVLMAFPIIMLEVKSWPYFRQDAHA